MTTLRDKHLASREELQDELHYLEVELRWERSRWQQAGWFALGVMSTILVATIFAVILLT
jgi:hypothetical protein